MLSNGSDVMLGVIEATKYPKWANADRLAFMHRLASEGLGYYILSTRPVRERTQESLSLGTVAADDLNALLKASKPLGISLGLSVFPQEHLVSSRRELVNAAKNLSRSPMARSVDVLLLRFDGSPQSRRHTMVDTQLAIASTMREALCPKVKLAICPTLYADDVGGAGVTEIERDEYRSRLADLDESISLFWSGGTLMSFGVTPVSAKRVASQYRRPPAMWCNFPVNDSHGYERQLRLFPRLTGIQKALPSFDAVAFNPMKQLRLSEIPIISAFRALLSNSDDWEGINRQVCHEILGHNLGKVVWSQVDSINSDDARDRRLGQNALRLALEGEGSRYAAELTGWLNGLSTD